MSGSVLPRTTSKMASPGPGLARHIDRLDGLAGNQRVTS
jgi:hypothetical protein